MPDSFEFFLLFIHPWHKICYFAKYFRSPHFCQAPRSSSCRWGWGTRCNLRLLPRWSSSRGNQVATFSQHLEGRLASQASPSRGATSCTPCRPPCSWWRSARAWPWQPATPPHSKEDQAGLSKQLQSCLLQRASEQSMLGTCCCLNDVTIPCHTSIKGSFVCTS